jgi:serine/threonine protein kinase
VHMKNYVHRDLKPENVLIGDPNNSKISTDNEAQDDLKRSIKLADFGLSASFRISTAHSLDERMGTLLFMAPE